MGPFAPAMSVPGQLVVSASNPPCLETLLAAFG
jgi:hypothetical protein